MVRAGRAFCAATSPVGSAEQPSAVRDRPAPSRTLGIRGGLEQAHGAARTLLSSLCMSVHSARDIIAGAGGAAIMLAGLLTPFLRNARNRWGVDEATAKRTYPGDDLVGVPQWSWTHGIEIDAPAEEVWPWVAQIGADRAGFYSYQWLENLAGCELRNAETIHPEWAIRENGALLLHPDMPAFRVASIGPGKWFVAQAPLDEAARAAGKAWAAVSWLFFVEPLDAKRCRVISRYRCSCSEDLRTRLQLGPTLIEPIGFAMDRRMLKGIKERAEKVAQQKPLRRVAVDEISP